jgi:hypothetical protein
MELESIAMILNHEIAISIDKTLSLGIHFSKLLSIMVGQSLADESLIVGY